MKLGTWYDKAKVTGLEFCNATKRLWERGDLGDNHYDAVKKLMFPGYDQVKLDALYDEKLPPYDRYKVPPSAIREIIDQAVKAHKKEPREGCGCPNCKPALKPKAKKA